MQSCKCLRRCRFCIKTQDGQHHKQEILYSDFHRIEFAWCGIWAIKQQFLNRAPVKFKQKPSHISTVINATDLDQLLLPEWSEIQLSVAVAELGRLSTRFFWHT